MLWAVKSGQGAGSICNRDQFARVMSILTRAFRKARTMLGRDPRLEPIDDCVSGRLPITIALMRLASTITEELVGKLVEWRVLRRDSRVRDYGRGIGRVIQQLAPRAATVVGGDISAGRLAGGACLIVMNWSYGLWPAEQRARARDLARRCGLEIVRNGTAEFSFWDGLVFHFRKTAR